MRKCVLAMGCAMALTVPSPAHAQADRLTIAGQGSSIGVQVNDLASDEAATATVTLNDDTISITRDVFCHGAVTGVAVSW